MGVTFAQWQVAYDAAEAEAWDYSEVEEQEQRGWDRYATEFSSDEDGEHFDLLGCTLPVGSDLLPLVPGAPEFWGWLEDQIRRGNV